MISNSKELVYCMYMIKRAVALKVFYVDKDSKDMKDPLGPRNDRCHLILGDTTQRLEMWI